MKNGLANQQSCPRTPPRNRPSESCVASYISKESCEKGGGAWTKVLINYKEKLSENNGACPGIQSVKGVAYEAHTITQGTGNDEQYVVKVDKPQVIYAPSTVVNHNGLNMQGKFSSYKWKVPFFPSQTIQRCVLRIRYDLSAVLYVCSLRPVNRLFNREQGARKIGEQNELERRGVGGNPIMTAFPSRETSCVLISSQRLTELQITTW